MLHIPDPVEDAQSVSNKLFCHLSIIFLKMLIIKLDLDVRASLCRSSTTTENVRTDIHILIIGRIDNDLTKKLLLNNCNQIIVDVIKYQKNRISQ